MQLNPSASNALKESQIHHIFQGLNEHKYHPCTFLRTQITEIRILYRLYQLELS